MESRTQGSRPRPRTRKKSEAKARTALPRTDTLEAKDRNARGQGHKRKCSPKKKVFTKIFQAISTKKRFPKNFSSAPQNFNNSKNTAVLEPRTGQFWRTCGLEAKAKDFKMCPRGQERPRGLHLCYLHYKHFIVILPNSEIINLARRPTQERKKKGRSKMS